MYFQIMLSACSTYFDTILSQHDENKAIVILKDVKFSDIQALVSFMYKGEINVENVCIQIYVVVNYCKLISNNFRPSFLHY